MYKGFTLIELLVVIAIIAILAAYLFPVFARAKAKAQSTQCLANMKQQGMAIIMYCSDWDSRYPPAYLWQSRCDEYRGSREGRNKKQAIRKDIIPHAAIRNLLQRIFSRFVISCKPHDRTNRQ